MTDLTPAEIYRPHSTPGVPASGAHKPVKREIIALLNSFADGIAAGFSSSGLSYASRAALYANLAPADNSLAQVRGDATSAYNGYYRKDGAPGTGSWTRIADLSGSYVVTATGGTGDAIEADIAPGLPATPGQHLYIFVPAANNTGAVTIEVDGAAPVAIKNTFGTDLAAGSLIEGVPQLLVWMVDHYALLLPQEVDGNAILATAVAAKNDAEDARDDAEAAAAGVNLPAIIAGSAGKLLQVKADESGHELVESADAGARTFGLKSLLSAADWADVRDATNVRDIATPLNAKILDLHNDYPGCTLDARAWRGVTEWEQDIFAGIHTADIRLITGRQIIQKEMRTGEAGAGAIRRPSKLRWEMDGTIIRPLNVITGTLSSPNDTEKSMLSSWLGLTTGSGTYNSTSLTLGSAAGVHIGSQIAIEGMFADAKVSFVLSGNINSSAMTINLTTPTTHYLASGYCYFQIDNEIILGSINPATGVITVTGRGRNGSTAASHTSGAIVYWVRSQVATVEGIAGNVLTLSAPLVNNVTGAVVHIGAFDHHVSGHFEIDGMDNPANSGSYFQCLGATLARRCSVTGRGILRRASFAGAFEYAGNSNLIELAEISTVGRSGPGFGGGLWIFGGCGNVQAKVDFIAATVNGVLIDNKSESEGLFGLEAVNNFIHVEVGTAVSLQTGFGIAGTRDSTIRFKHLSATAAGGINNNEGQTTSALDFIRNNVVTIDSDECGSGASGDVLNKDGNRVIRGRMAPFIVSVAMPSTNIPTTGAEVNFSVPGVASNAFITANFQFTPTGGIGIAYARATATDTVKVWFENDSSGTVNGVSGNILFEVINR